MKKVLVVAGCLLLLAVITVAVGVYKELGPKGLGEVARYASNSGASMVPIDDSRWFDGETVVSESVGESTPVHPACPSPRTPEFEDEFRNRRCSVIIYADDDDQYLFWGWQRPTHERQVGTNIAGVAEDIHRNYGDRYFMTRSHIFAPPDATAVSPEASRPVVATAPCKCGETSCPLPQGWRLPQATETKQAFRREDTNGYLRAAGDFDADGDPDLAVLLVNEGRGKLGLFGYWQRTAGCEMLLVEEFGIDSMESLGLRSIPSGEHQTACGKGYWECAAQEAPLVRVKGNGLGVFTYESAEAMFYWDDVKQGLVKVWLSD